MMRINQLGLALFLLCSLVSHAQLLGASSTLTKIAAYYDTVKQYNEEVNYKMYKGYTGHHLTESYSGTMYKDNEISQIKILGTEILQFGDIQLTIDKSTKTIIYNRIGETGIKNTPVDVSVFLKYYKESTTRQEGNMLIHEMVLKNPQVLTVPYNKIILYVNKNTHKLDKQELYFANKLPFVDEKGKETPDVGRMEISFTSLNKPPKVLPKLNHYIQLEANNSIKLTAAYSGYTLVDQTK